MPDLDDLRCQLVLVGEAVRLPLVALHDRAGQQLAPADVALENSLGQAEEVQWAGQEDHLLAQQSLHRHLVDRILRSGCHIHWHRPNLGLDPD